MGVLTGRTINNNHIFFDYSFVKKLIYDFYQSIVTVELLDSRCYNCKINSLMYFPKAMALAECGLFEVK